MNSISNKINDKFWLVIVNPNAGRRKIEKDWENIRELLLKAELQFHTVFTEHKEHAINLTQEFIEKGVKKFVVVGGDGTLNEVVNGIFSQKNITSDKFTVGIIPVGTGNDWCRMFNIPFKYKKAIKIIRKERTFIQDVGKVQYHNSSDQKSRYFINVAGMGYDAVVAAKTNRDKETGRSGPLSYLKNLLTSLFFYKFSTTTISIDENDEVIKNKTFSLSVGICKYNGGGMMQLPKAIPNDGLLDLTLIKKIGRFAVIRNIKRLFDGTLPDHPKVITFKGKTFSIHSDPEISLEVDGESLGHSPFKFEIIPLGLKMVIGNKELP
ncbi:MAG: diacylglycerol kinase family lipid kinase [Bacteroidales bacterium]|nr:diacylglycerol kinase family lipid kinase [Bacteroidales bacterium]